MKHLYLLQSMNLGSIPKFDALTLFSSIYAFDKEMDVKQILASLNLPVELSTVVAAVNSGAYDMNDVTQKIVFDFLAQNNCVINIATV